MLYPRESIRDTSLPETNSISSNLMSIMSTVVLYNRDGTSHHPGFLGSGESMGLGETSCSQSVLWWVRRGAPDERVADRLYINIDEAM